MKKLLSIIIALTATMSLAAQTPEQWDSLRTFKWSVYGQGGVSFASGGHLLSNKLPTPGTEVKPMFGGGVTCTIQPWVRVSANYTFSKYYREQRFDGINAENPVDLLAYRQMRKMYHAIDLTGEFNICELWKRQNKRFNLWGGAGFGGIFTQGPDYTITLYGNEERPVGVTPGETIGGGLKAHTVRGRNQSFYIPVLLHAEYDVLPQITLGIRAQANALLKGKREDLPFMTEQVGVTVRYNFVKSPYKAPKIVERTETIIVNNDELIKKLNDDINALRKALEDCKGMLIGTRTVYFETASYALDEKANATLDKVAKMVEEYPDMKFWLTASCDAYASEAYNMKLSENRAKAVYNALIARGVPAEKIEDMRWIGKSGQSYDPHCRRVLIEFE